jgi:leucyl-tRNA synthetase
VIKDGAKMSKNKGNVVSAEEMIDRFGADTGRLFELFAAPPEKDMDWTDAGAEGAYRFLGRVCRFVTRNADRAGEGEPAADRRALRKLHQVIGKITEDFEHRWHFNTSIASLMELVNVLHAEEEKLSRAALDQILPALTLLLAPFAPYLAEELWESLDRTGPVFRQAWPGGAPGEWKGPWPYRGPIWRVQRGTGDGGSSRSQHATFSGRQASHESGGRAR